MFLNTIFWQIPTFACHNKYANEGNKHVQSYVAIPLAIAAGNLFCIFLSWSYLFLFILNEYANLFSFFIGCKIMKKIIS